nr:MAG TPA: hypothetical protein [Caudoviricetes sp.]
MLTRKPDYHKVKGNLVGRKFLYGNLYDSKRY